jgi:peptide/nickel transport system ATP-binding protein
VSGGGGDDGGGDSGRPSSPSAYPIPLVAPGDGGVDSGRPSSPSSYPIPLIGKSDGGGDSGRPSSPSSYPIPLVRDAARDDAPPLLCVRDLVVTFATDGGALRALDGVSFDVPRGRTVALVGESGCGKTVTALSVLGLLPEQSATVVAGSIALDGVDLLTLGEREMRAVRGARAAMVFQEPMTSLNPVYTVGAQIAEAIRLHRRVSRDAARHAAIGLLRKVGFPQPETRVDSYPHELSGGMRQRVMIAIALAPGPALLIADEPTTALDMTTQAQILELLDRLKAETAMSLLLIAHDLAVVAELADEVVVLYAGVVVERGTARDVLRAPAHPYTQALLRSLPARGFRGHRVRGEKARRLPTIAGALPDLRDPPPGCRFQDRCEAVFDRCRKEAPELYPVAPGPRPHAARCFRAAPDAPAATAMRREGAA